MNGQETGAPAMPARGFGAKLAEPLRRFVRTEASSAGLLLIATVAALVWANLSDSYEAFWHTELSMRLGDSELSLDLQHWVNDGLMVFFFFVVGLEVKRELSMGELTDRRRAAVPLAAALTGLAVPALVYLGFNPEGEAARAWGVVISTDTAFLLGVLALVGPASASQLRLFLLTLAVADDVAALTVIALFYTEDLALLPLGLVGLGLVLIVVMRYLRIWRGPAYLVVAVAIWVAMHESGVHPTLAGVAIAMLIPAYPPRRAEVEEAERLTAAFRQSPNPQYARAARRSIDRTVSGNERLTLLYGPWSSFVIVPIFALANAGVVLDRGTLQAAASSPVTLGIVAALVGGKLIGVLGGALLARGLRLGSLAPGLGPGQLAGGAALSGIGFTISLFIVDLALTDPELADQARVGVLAASLLAAVLGGIVLRAVARRDPQAEQRPTRLVPPVDPAEDHIRGPVDAPLTLVEFGDYECPFCARVTGTLEILQRRFGDQLRYVFRHVPLVDVHPHAELAAEAAEAADEQGAFWAMHDRLYAHQDRLAAADLLGHAEALGLDVARFARDLGSGRRAARVRDAAASAEASGVRGTPTFFVNGRRHRGPYDADALTAALLAEVDGAAAPPPATGAGSAPAPGVRGDAEPDVRLDATLPPADTAPTTDADGAFPTLTQQQLATLSTAATREVVERGSVLFHAGDLSYDFFVLLGGAVAILDRPGREDQRVVSVHGPGRFLGEYNLLTGDPPKLSAVALDRTELLRVPAAQLGAILDLDPDISRLVLRAFLLRRALLMEAAAAAASTT